MTCRTEKLVPVHHEQANLGFIRGSGHVCYTHLTVPTDDSVWIAVVGGALKKKKQNNKRRRNTIHTTIDT